MVVIGRLRAIAVVVVFDIAAPLATYGALRAAGLSAATALLLSGVFPAGMVAASVIRQRRVDVAGALVLAGIVVGAVLSLVSHNAKLMLTGGSVPTAVFGAGSLASLWVGRPLMYGLALEFTGPDTAPGQEMIRLWQYPGYRHVFRVITAVWGAGFLIEAAARVVIVYQTSTGTGLASSQVTPFVWAGALSAWTVAYGAWQRKKGQREAAAEGFSWAADQKAGQESGGSAAAGAGATAEDQRSSTLPKRQ